MRNRTARRGPYFIELQEDLVVVRCAYPFKVVRTDEIESSDRAGKDYSTRPFALPRGMRATLKGEGLPDETIDGGAA